MLMQELVNKFNELHAANPAITNEKTLLALAVRYNSGQIQHEEILESDFALYRGYAALPEVRVLLESIPGLEDNSRYLIGIRDHLLPGFNMLAHEDDQTLYELVFRVIFDGLNILEVTGSRDSIAADSLTSYNNFLALRPDLAVLDIDSNDDYSSDDGSDSGSVSAVRAEPVNGEGYFSDNFDETVAAAPYAPVTVSPNTEDEPAAGAGVGYEPDFASDSDSDSDKSVDFSKLAQAQALEAAFRAAHRDIVPSRVDESYFYSDTSFVGSDSSSEASSSDESSSSDEPSAKRVRTEYSSDEPAAGDGVPVAAAAEGYGGLGQTGDNDDLLSLDNLPIINATDTNSFSTGDASNLLLLMGAAVEM